MTKSDAHHLPVPTTIAEFKSLNTGLIKALFTHHVTEELLALARQDSRKAVQTLVTSYEKRQAKEAAELERLRGMYVYEEEWYKEGKSLIAGVDEVGRGPIAGPVTVAAVILPPHLIIPGLNDSKKVAPHKREEIYDVIMGKAIAVSCISYGPEVIDELNIYEATRKAMYEAVETLSVKAEAVLVDAMKLPNLSMPVTSLIKGDSKSASIAAASIIAKVTRDRYMESLEEEWPGFGFGEHKGYYTAVHKEAIENLGITPLHRRSFEPVKSMVAEEE